MHGLCEVVLPVGRADAASETNVFEVEPAQSWRDGARQALAYAGQTGWEPALALFGRADYLSIYLFLRDRIPAITLWVWRGQWEWTTNRQRAAIKYAPLIHADAPQPSESIWHTRARAENSHLADHEIDQVAQLLRATHFEKAAARARVARFGGEQP